MFTLKHGIDLRTTADHPACLSSGTTESTAVPTLPPCFYAGKDPIPTGKGRSDLRGRPVPHRQGSSGPPWMTCPPPARVVQTSVDDLSSTGNSVGRAVLDGTGVLLVPCPSRIGRWPPH
jgi:hypothetical protein